MALIAALAVAAAAFLASVAVGGHQLFGVVVRPGILALCLVPGVLAVAAGRRAPTLTLAARVRGRAPKGLSPGLVVLALLLVASAGKVPAGALTGLAGAAALAVVALSGLWPQPLALRAGLVFSVMGLLAPTPRTDSRPAALVALAAAVAVGLVATNRLAVARLRRLDGGSGGSSRRTSTPRPVAPGAAAVLAALALAALVTNLVEPPSRRPQAQTGAQPESQQPAPLGFVDALDPSDEGAEAGGNRGDRDEVVLRIDADRPAVWRAQTFDRWDGRRWARSPQLTESTFRSFRFLRPPLDLRLPLDLPGEAFGDPLVQRVRVEAPFAAVAVGAPRLRSLQVPGGASAAPDGSVRLDPPLGRGATYVAQSETPQIPESVLRSIDIEVGPAPLGGSYLDPPALSQRARALAATVTAGSSSAYDKVRALERWLDANVEVDDAAGALPAGADVVDSVLFGERRGTPQRLATTLALLARSEGIRSRLATGFLAGDRSVFGGDYVVRAGHAHAWVEVPFPTVGWQSFDPTGRIAQAQVQDSLANRLRRLLSRWWAVLLGAALLALVALTRWLVLRRHRRNALPWVSRYFARLARLGARRGRPPRPSETPVEYTRALAGGVLADERLYRIGEVVTEAAWSGRAPPEGERRWAEEVLAEVAATGDRRRWRRRTRVSSRALP